jgi:hypothetical protein
MKLIDSNKIDIKRLRIGLRLNTPAPKIMKHAKDYTRKIKHKSIYKYEEN